jgi:hypothetical protein
MAIADDFTIDYVNQRVYHSSGTSIYTLNQLYTYFTLTFDDDLQMDDLPPMSAQTPTAFTVENGWYMDPVSLQFLNGGSLATLGWSSTTYDNGIRVFTFGATYTSAIASDIGKPVVYTGGTPTDAGTLLYYDNTLKKWWVRTVDTGDTFANTATAIVITGGTGTGILSAASTTGENTWANVFTLGTLATNTQIYLYQAKAQIAPWWAVNPATATAGLGHIDVLVLVKEAGTLIDYGYVTIFVRQYSKLYDHYTADLSAGARTPIPLATFDDANNLSGYWQFTGSGGSGTFVVGEIIQIADRSMQGIVTAVGGTTVAPVLTYYLFRYPLTNFTNGTAIVGVTSAAACTAGTPSSIGPASLAGVTATFGATNQDLNNGNGSRPYSVVINCNNTSLSTVYEYLKYLTRYGNSDALNGHNGEMYTGIGDIRVAYDAQSVNFVEGEAIHGATSLATGYIVSDHDAGVTGYLVLRDVTGTFVDNEELRTGLVAGGTLRAVANILGGAETISPSKQSPFGTFAGGKFFGARGVWLSNVPTADANNYQLIDTLNATQIPPMSITLTVNGILNGDQVAVFQATGDNNIVNKSMYNIQAVHTSPVAYIRIEESIPNDTPTAGFIRVVRRSATGTIIGEEKYTYTSFSNANQPTYSQFTLSGNTTQNYATTDTVYVPYIDQTATGSSVSVALIYTSSRYITARVRKSGILPFMIKSSITNSNLTITAVRATDSIA